MQGRRARRTNAPKQIPLARILDHIPMGVGIFDESGALVHANSQFEQVVGGALPSIHAMTGRDWRAFLPDGSALDEQHWPAHRALKGEDYAPRVDFRHTTNCGDEHWVGVRAVPLTSSDDLNVVGAVIIVEDVKLRRRTEALFRGFAKYSSNALWIANLETGIIEYMSAAATRIWTNRGIITSVSEWIESVHPDDREKAIELRRLVGCGEAQRFEYRLIDMRGVTTHHLRETSFPIPDDTGGDDCVGSIVEDISPEVQIYLVQGGTNDGSDLLDELRNEPRRVKKFTSREDMMNVADVLNPGCVVVDLRGTKSDPCLISELLRKRPNDLQLVFVGQADTSQDQVIAAMRAGARDFLIAPLAPGALTRAIHTASESLPARYEALGARRDDVAHRLGGLPRREREVLMGLVAGGTNKSIARDLSISHRTVETHRSHLMDRLQVRTLTELLRLAHEAGIRAK